MWTHSCGSPVLKLLFVTAEFPYPPTHGGRSDTWQRIVAFAEAGVDIHLICWYSDRRGGAPSEAELEVVRGIVRTLVVLPITLTPTDLAWRLFRLGRVPSHATARLPRGRVRRELLDGIDRFGPDAIWVDGLWAAAFGRDVARRLNLPYFYRSHNIEYRYMARQTALARSPAYRFRLQMNLFGLERFERDVVMGAAQVFDISVDDLRYWESQGLQHGRWLPPFVRGKSAATADVRPPRRYDVVFVGNLHTPNNVEALRWLLRRVWPRVRKVHPHATALIAGSAPSGEVKALAAEAAGVELLADPVDVWPLYRAARVLVNPMKNGSGLNIKSAEMLQFEVPIISTSVGVTGMPEQVRSQFVVVDDEDGFAAAISRVLGSQEGAVDTQQRAGARLAFSPEAIHEVIRSMVPSGGTVSYSQVRSQ